MGRLAQVNIVSIASHSKSEHASDISVPGLLGARFLLAVTAAAGTNPTLEVTIEGKTRSGNYVTIASFAQISSESSQSIDVVRIPQNYRINWKISGTTPTFTFEVDAIHDLG